MKECNGNPGKRPLPAEAPPAPGAPAMPPDVAANPDAAECWRDTLALLPPGVAKSTDARTLAAYCLAWADLLRATRDITEHGGVIVTEGGRLYPNPAVAQQRTASKIVADVGGRFGLDPSSRSRVHVAEAKEDAEDARFFGPER